jgi:hypothetical protein
MLEGWEKEHPQWRIEVLLWILDRALRSLRGYLEKSDESPITWENPYVELHYPIECNWADHSIAEAPHFHLQTGTLNSRDTVDQKTAAAAMSRLLVRHFEIAALQDWTNHSAFEKRGEQYQAVGSAELLEDANAISDPVEREQASEALFWPKSFGAGTIDYSEFVEGEPIGRDTAEQLAAIEPPLIYVPLEIDGHKVRLITILEVKPLIADADTKTAHFPIVVGLAIQAGIGETITVEWLEQPWASLSRWKDEDRTAIWDILHELIAQTLEALGPKPEPEMEEAILAVHAEIKVLARKGDRGLLQRAIAEAVAHFQKTGEITKLDVTQRRGDSMDQGLRQRLKELVKQVDEAKWNDEKGKSLEALVSALFGSVTGFDIAERIKTETEEIDLWITNNIDTGALRREGDVILAECKNWMGRCGKNEFVALLHKMINRSRRCTLGFLISWNGFADTVTKEMLRGSREEVLIVPLGGSDLRTCADSDHFLALLLRARQQALMV